MLPGHLGFVSNPAYVKPRSAGDLIKTTFLPYPMTYVWDSECGSMWFLEEGYSVPAQSSREETGPQRGDHNTVGDLRWAGQRCLALFWVLSSCISS